MEREKREKATFGAGCFWGVEETFRKTPGVAKTTVGYAGGFTQNPTYEKVCSGKTGHAEVLHVEFDPAIVSFADLLEVFWNCHDPTTRNRQGPDIGTQYRSIILYHSEDQQQQALRSKQAKETSKIFSSPIVTEIAPFESFQRAEEYHQCYLEKRGASACFKGGDS